MSCCAVCDTPLVRRTGEHPSNFAKRRTCGARECVHEWRCRTCGQVLGVDPVEWWVPLPDAPTFTPSAFANEDPRAAAPEPPLRIARPADPRTSVVGNRWAEVDEY